MLSLPNKHYAGCHKATETGRLTNIWKRDLEKVIWMAQLGRKMEAAAAWDRAGKMIEVDYDLCFVWSCVYDSIKSMMILP